MAKKTYEVNNIKINGTLLNFEGKLNEVATMTTKPILREDPIKREYTLEINSMEDDKSKHIMKVLVDLYTLTNENPTAPTSFNIEMEDIHEPWKTYSGTFTLYKFKDGTKDETHTDTPSKMWLALNKGTLKLEIDDSNRPKFTVKDMTQREIELAISGLKTIEKQNYPGFTKLIATRAKNKLEQALLN